MRPRSSLFPIILILVGIYFLLEKQGLIPNIGPLLRDWWPVLLIAAGIALLVSRSRRGG